MNTEFKSVSCGDSRNYIREEKLKQSQVYKKKNQQHPAFKN